jgi:hypothetical protein
MPQEWVHKRRLKQGWRYWVTTGSGLVAVAYILQVVLRWPLPGWLSPLLLVVGGLATVGGATLPAIGTERHTHMLEAASDAQHVQLRGYIDSLGPYFIPLTLAIDQVVSSSNTDECKVNKAALKQLILDATYSELFPKGTRCCYLTLVLRGSTRKLVCKKGDSVGRSDVPICEFVEGKDSGRHVFADIIDAKSSKHNPNIKKSEFPEWDESLGFRTYIACAVASDEEVFGMLTIDAENVGDFEDRHHDLLRVFAQLLGSMFAVK